MGFTVITLMLASSLYLVPVLSGQFPSLEPTKSTPGRMISGIARPIDNQRPIATQISTLRRYGYNINKLDNHTQLKTFLYTWLAMERGEGGWCNYYGVAPPPDEHGLASLSPYPLFQACCTGWKPVMAICTKSSWYNGAEKDSIVKTVAEISRIMRS